MFRNFSSNNKGQMLMIEAVLFSIMVLVAISFISQLSPPAVVSHRYSNNLKIWGDNVLLGMYNKGINDTIPVSYPNNTLSYYLINNSHDRFVENFSKDPRISKASVMYNVYISNGTKTIFWVNSQSDTSGPLTPIGSVSKSHRLVSIDPSIIYQTEPDKWFSSYNPINESFVNLGYNQSTYDILVDLWFYA